MKTLWGRCDAVGYTSDGTTCSANGRMVFREG
jgi:hypothetical protein